MLALVVVAELTGEGGELRESLEEGSVPLGARAHLFKVLMTTLEDSFVGRVADILTEFFSDGLQDLNFLLFLRLRSLETHIYEVSKLVIIL